MRIFELFGDVVLRGTGDAERQLESLDNRGGKASKVFGAIGGAALVAGAAIGGAFLFALKDGVQGLMDMEQQTAQLDAVLKSTNNAVGLSRDSITGMADALEKTTKFAAEQTLEGQNLLLTFTKIGADVFPRATEAMLDMATGMGTDASSQAIALGKALNDPIAGVTALGRVGVQFTDEQKKTIEQMVAMNDIAGAQGIILTELETQFGGSAEAAGKTFAGQMEIAKNAVGEIYESLAVQFMPVLQTMLSWVMDNMPTIKMVFQTVFDVIGASIKFVWDFINAYFLPIFKTLFDWIQSNMPTIKSTVKTVFDAIVTVAKTLYDFFVANLLPIYKQLYDWIVGNMPKLQEVATKVFDRIISIATKLWEFFKAELLPIFAALYKWVNDNMPTIQAVFEAVFGAIFTAIEVVWDLIEFVLLPILKALWDFIKPTFPLIGKLFEVTFGAIAIHIQNVSNGFQTLVEWVRTAVDWINQFNSKEIKQKEAPTINQPPSRGGELPKVSGKRALGGPVNAGQTYMVGERGPELVTFGRSGQVTPNNQLGGQGISITINNPVMTDRRMVDEIGKQLVSTLRAKGLVTT
jgi:hypothetical protein